MNYYGLVMGSIMILAAGLGHVLVIKWEYYWGVKSWPGLLALGLLPIVVSCLVDSTLLSGGLGILGATLLWGVFELFKQKKRVEKGWFPRNPKRKM
ncbi:MAG: DUF4491 family protein [Chloroflexota bacterium]|nr:DUF4491 family protein [Chloroflexota bacterium]